MTFKIEDFSEAFKHAQNQGLKLVLVGGQACHFYAEKFLRRSKTLQDLIPLTSDDIDFFGNTNEAISLANAFGVQFIPSPQKGGMRGLVLGVIEYKNLKIEILGHVNGLKDEVARKAVLSVANGVSPTVNSF